MDGVNIRDINLHDLRSVVSLVMQEPSIFNYSIMENILYGKLDATNQDIMTAAALGNCNEFIERQDLGSTELDDSPSSLQKEMEKNKEAIVKMIGEKKYDEEMEVLKKLVA